MVGDKWESLPQKPGDKTGSHHPDPGQTRPSGKVATDRTPPPPPAAHRAVRPADLPESFGRYRILKKLGQGGMGTVYLAEDPQLDRRVALKVPHIAADDREVLARFYREARAAATVDHPNVCPVYDVGEVHGVPYVTMAFVEGRPLSELVRDGKPLPQRPVAAVVRKLAQALQEAHARDVIHRDLKPANVMINRRKEPVVMDFGLARRADKDAQLTRDGAMLGTPAYMPPEQVLGDVAAMGPGCDIYSLGVMLYQLLTGQLPFQGTVMSVLGRILTEEPRRPTELRPDLDPALEAICLKAMSKKVDDRYGSMAELAAALGDYLRTGSAQPVPSQVASASASSDEPTAAEASEKATESGLATELLGRLLDRLENAPAPAPQEPRRSLLWLVTIVLFLALGGIGGALAYHFMPRAQEPQSPQTPQTPTTVVVQLQGLTDRINNPAVTQLFLDGNPVTREELAGEVKLAPGPHVLVLKSKDGVVIERLTFTVGEKDREEVQLVKPPSTPDSPKLEPGKLAAKDIGNREVLESFFTIREVGYDSGKRKVDLTLEAKENIDYIPRDVRLEFRLYDADDARIGFGGLHFGGINKVKKGESIHATFPWPNAGVKKVLLTPTDEKALPTEQRPPVQPISTASLPGGAALDFKSLEESFVILKGSHDLSQQRFHLLVEARRDVEYFPRDVRLLVRFYDAKSARIRADFALKCEQDSRILQGERVRVYFSWKSNGEPQVAKVVFERPQ